MLANPVSPLSPGVDKQLDAESGTTADQFADAEDPATSTVNLNLSAWSTRSQSEQDKRALMPPPKAPPQGPVTGRLMRSRSYRGEEISLQDVVNAQGEISCLDGEMVNIPPHLLTPGPDSNPQRLDSTVRKQLLETIPKAVYTTLPEIWFSNWIHLAIGIVVNPEFKEAVMRVSEQNKVTGGFGFMSSESEMECEDTDTETLADNNPPDMASVDPGVQVSNEEQPGDQASAASPSHVWCNESGDSVES